MAKKTEKTDEKAKPAKGKTTAKAAPAKAPAKKPAAKGGKAAKPAEKPAAKPAPAPQPARGPLVRVKALHGSKEALAKKIAEPLAVGDQDPDVISEQLRTASNQQLLRLARVVETVQQKWGGRDQLIQALGAKLGKAKDKDYLAKLGTFSLPRLLDMARGAHV
jgi:hypothetical protein